MALKGMDVRHLVSASTGLDIPVIAAKGMVFSAWEPSPEDIEKFKMGHPLWLIQKGIAVPEMTMLVATRNEVVPASYTREAVDIAKYDKVIHETRSQRQKDAHTFWVGLSVLGTVSLVLFAWWFLGR